MIEKEMADILLAKSLVSIQDLNRELNQLLWNNGGVSSITAANCQPLPLRLQEDIRTAALGTEVLGTAALGKSLINQPLVWYLLDHLLWRSLGFASQSLVRSFRGGVALVRLFFFLFPIYK